MIIWIDGAFGAGKTQTAYELLRRTCGTVLIDPEDFGIFLRRRLPRELHKSDYRDHEVWRTANRMLISEAASGGFNVIVPMTLSDRKMFADTAEALSREHKVAHIVLSTSPELLKKRLHSRLEFGGWAYDQMKRTISFYDALSVEKLSWDYRLDTSFLSISEAAEAIAEICGLEITPAGNALLSALRRAAVTLKHIR